MPRQRKAELARQERDSAALELATAIQQKSSPRFAPRKTVAAELHEMIQSGDWSRARAAHFVALYLLGHAKVYGVPAAELEGKGKSATNARKGATSAAAKMLAQEFGGRPKEMAAFFDWAWRREQGREQWRRENKRDGGRLGWQTMIAGRAILTDYRAARLRAVP